MNSLEKEADRTFQGYFAAPRIVSEKQAEFVRRDWEIRNADIALCDRRWNSIRRINCLIKFKGKRDGYLDN